jgi:hypothetical protein
LKPTIEVDGRKQTVSTSPRRLRMEAEIVGQPIRQGTLSRRKRAWVKESVKEMVISGIPYTRAVFLCTWSLERYGSIDTDWLIRGEV